MLAIWIAAFIVGVLLGRSLHVLPAVPDVARLALLLMAGLAFVLAKKARSNTARWTWAWLAAVWGLIHAAPFPRAALSEAQVVQVSRNDSANGPIIVATPAGVRYEASGPQRPGVSGVVTLRPMQRLFADARAVFRARVTDDERLAPIDGLAGIVTRALAARLESVPPELRSWVLAVVLGQTKGLSIRLQHAFLETGLIHLLVVSGSHVAFFGFLLSLILRFPGQLAYALRLISARRFRHFTAATCVLSAGVGIVYAAATGFSVPSQRAVIVFVLLQLGKAFGGLLPKISCLLLAGFLQTIFYPIGFVSESCLMSWCAFLLVIAAFDPADERGDFWQRFGRSCALQGEILVVAGVVFGNLSLISFVANLVVAPLFPFLLTGALLALVVPDFAATPLVWLFHEKTLDLVRSLAAQSSVVGGNLLAASAHPPLLRVLLVPPAVVLLLNACRKLSISRYASA